MKKKKSLLGADIGGHCVKPLPVYLLAMASLLQVLSVSPPVQLPDNTPGKARKDISNA